MAKTVIDIVFDAAKWSMDDSGTWLSIKVEDPRKARSLVSLMSGEKWMAAIREWKQKRSLDANAYFWTLVNKISSETRISPTEIYREMVKEVPDNKVVICVQNTQKKAIMKGWEQKGIGWISEDLGDSKIDGCSNLRLTMGSSTYDTKQMSILIDLAVQECKQLGIETMTPEEIARLEGLS